MSLIHFLPFPSSLSSLLVALKWWRQAMAAALSIAVRTSRGIPRSTNTTPPGLPSPYGRVLLIPSVLSHLLQIPRPLTSRSLPGYHDLIRRPMQLRAIDNGGSGSFLSARTHGRISSAPRGWNPAEIMGCFHTGLAKIAILNFFVNKVKSGT